MRISLEVTIAALVVIVMTSLAQTNAVQNPAPPGQLYIFSGTIRSIDLKARVLLVESETIPQKFVVPTDTAISVKDKRRNADLSDLMVGDPVQVKYTDDSGAHVAHQISILGLETP